MLNPGAQYGAAKCWLPEYFAQLGDRFDIRDFHAEVLKDGSVPLDILEGKIERWIEARKA